MAEAPAFGSLPPGVARRLATSPLGGKTARTTEFRVVGVCPECAARHIRAMDQADADAGLDCGVVHLGCSHSAPASP